MRDYLRLLLHGFVFDGGEGILYAEAPDPNPWPQIRAAWDAFTEHVVTKNSPLLTKGDVRERTDAEWIAAAKARPWTLRRSRWLGSPRTRASAEVA